MKLKILFISLMLSVTPKLACATLLTAINHFLLAAQTGLEDVSEARKNIPEQSRLSSWIEKTEIRINDSDELSKKNSSTQNYEIRVEPKAWGQRDAEQKILQLSSDQEDAELSRTLNNELSRRYAFILDLIEQRIQTRSLLETDDLLSKQVQLNRGTLYDTDFNEEKLLDAEVAFDRTKDMVDLHLHRLNELQDQLKLPAYDRETLMASDNISQWLVSIPQMQEIMEQPVEYQQIPDVTKSHLELEQATAENRQKKSKNQLGINLLRFRVDDRERNDLRLSFMVGVNIPLGAENFQTAKSHHDMYDASLKYHSSVYAASRELDQKRDKMKWLLEKWLFTQKQIDKLKDRTQKDYAKTNPKLALALQIELAKKFNESLTIHQEALRLYLSYLTSLGQLAHQPLRNWLHHAMPELHPMTAEIRAYPTD